MSKQPTYVIIRLPDEDTNPRRIQWRELIIWILLFHGFIAYWCVFWLLWRS